jgi:predicted nucleic acid-binding protein
VWSLALRRKSGNDHPAALELRKLVEDGRAALLGPIRQELLSGVREPQQFDELRSTLRGFPDVELTFQDFEDAARFFNLCQGKGVQGSNTDFLICAAAIRRKMQILTTDKDFTHFASNLPIVLHEPKPV